MTHPTEHETTQPSLRAAQPDDLDAVERLLTDSALPTVGVAALPGEPASSA